MAMTAACSAWPGSSAASSLAVSLTTSRSEFTIRARVRAEGKGSDSTLAPRSGSIPDVALVMPRLQSTMHRSWSSTMICALLLPHELYSARSDSTELADEPRRRLLAPVCESSYAPCSRSGARPEAASPTPNADERRWEQPESMMASTTTTASTTTAVMAMLTVLLTFPAAAPSSSEGSQVVPKELPVVTNQFVIERERAATWVGIAPQSKFELRMNPCVMSERWPSSVGIAPLKELASSEKEKYIWVSLPSSVGTEDESWLASTSKYDVS
mmetsp:Transcript_8974/g.22437  ORF Transcript_8974/g.22437 Transcript_8974/m.22437 type:complete len:271 (-) Transcript_8974:1227-2039(-)